MHIELASQTYGSRSSRRDFVKLSAAATTGLGMAHWLRLQAAGAITPQAPPKAVIQLYMGGGASQIDSFDPKPHAPSELRGPFETIASCLPGIRVTDQLPRMATQLDKMALLRAVHHGQSEHQQAAHYMLTGWMPSRVVFKNEHPSLGSVVVHETGDRLSMPPYVVLRDPARLVNRHHGSAFLSRDCDPFEMVVPCRLADVNADGQGDIYKAEEIPPPRNLSSRVSGLSVSRIRERRRLLRAYDRLRKQRDDAQAKAAAAVDHYEQKAFDIVTSQKAVTAFDLSREPARVRDRYGRSLLGQSCLLARRLVDAGVLFVTVSRGGWDTHKDNFNTLQNELLPELDIAMSALLEDLSDRGMLERTLVLWSGEFGRTPRVNKDVGRDHWPAVMTMGLAGGGVPGGQVIGQSDAHSAQPVDRALTPEDVWTTMYHHLGIDWRRSYQVPSGFEFKSVPPMVPILPRGTPIAELI
ncbi:MAG: hypothetical protein CMJ59_12560 [Planctomycetaceae bacterium]|nr:hypothetical protein [Planctomycetaceae bacterium]